MSSIRAKSKSLASDMLSKGFKPAKCKTTLKLAVSRIKLLKNKREVAVKQMRRELAQLLESGQEQTARIRVEHVIREEKTMTAYDLIEIYCELIVARMPIIEAHKSCPIDLKEAIASVIFASPRCADIPELMDVRKHFLAKYGKDFVNAALEVRPDCGVSRLVVEKLSARAPEVEIKMKILTAIAQEHNIKWDPKPFEDDLKKPKEDILDGPSTFANTNWLPEQSTYTRPSTQATESTKRKYDVPTSSDVISGATTSIPLRSQSEPTVSGQVPTDLENNISNSSGSSASWNRPNWNMEFKDATSAAQAAAESAEKASLAARAAAELASRGTFSRQFSADMHGISTYHSRSQEPEAPKTSKPAPANNITEYPKEEGNKFRTNSGIQQDNQTMHRDEAANLGSPKGFYDSNQGDVRRPSSPSFSYKASANENVPEVDSQLGNDMQYSQTQTSFSMQGSSLEDNKGKNSEAQDSGGGYRNDIYSKKTSNLSKGSFVYDKFEKPSTDLGERNSPSASSNMKTEFGGNSHVFYDDYLSDNGNLGSGENLLDILSSRNGEKDAALEDRWSPKPKQSVFDEKVMSSGLPTMSVPQDTLDGETGKEDKVSLHLDDDRPVAFDDSDGLESEAEDVSGKAATQLNSSLNSFGRLSLADSMNRKEEIGHVNKTSHSPFISNAYRRNNEADSGFSKKSQDNDTSSGSEPASPKSSYSSKGMTYRTSTNRPNAGSSKARLSEKPESENRSSLFSANDSPQSDFSDDSVMGLNLPKLRGGLRNKKGFTQPPYVKDPSFNASQLSQQNDDDASFISEKPLTSHAEKSRSEFEILSYEPKSDRISSKSSRTTRTSSRDTNSRFGSNGLSGTHDASARRGPMEHPSLSLNKEHEISAPVGQNAPKEGKLSGAFFNDDLVEDKEPIHSARNRTKDGKLSRRTRNMVSDTKDDVLSTSSDQSYTPPIPESENKASRATSMANEPPHTSGPGSAEGRKIFNSFQQNSSGKQPTVAPSEAEIAKPKGEKPPSTTRFGSLEGRETMNSSSVSAKSSSKINSEGSASKRENQDNANSSEGSTSRENSLKSKSHVHPKLPDYESFAAHFKTLRANRRT